MADEALRSRLGAAGPQKAARFTLSQVIPQLDEVYLQALEYDEENRDNCAAREKTSPQASLGQTGQMK